MYIAYKILTRTCHQAKDWGSAGAQLKGRVGWVVVGNVVSFGSPAISPSFAKRRYLFAIMHRKNDFIEHKLSEPKLIVRRCKLCSVLKYSFF